jgi:hypothetical protein
VVTRRHVGDLPAGEEELPEVAEVLMAGCAARAPSARGDEPEHDVVAHRQSGHLGTDLHDLPGALVTSDHRKLLDPELLLGLVGKDEVPGEQVLVGVAQPGSDQLDQHFTAPRRVELDLLHAPVGLRLPQDRRVHLHRDRPFNWLAPIAARRHRRFSRIAR